MGMSEEAVKPLPYVHLLSGREAVEVLGETLREVEEVLAAFTPEQIDAKPAPHKWSIRETLCHMADCEVAWSWRYRQTLSEDNPLFNSFDQDRWAEAYTGSGFNAALAFATWHNLRMTNLALVATLTPEQLERTATHPERGSMKLSQMLEIAAGHDLHHRAALAKLLTV